MERFDHLSSIDQDIQDDSYNKVMINPVTFAPVYKSR
jgi:hypothetical protein